MKSRIRVFILAKTVILAKVALSSKVSSGTRLTRAFHGKELGNIRAASVTMTCLFL